VINAASEVRDVAAGLGCLVSAEQLLQGLLHSLLGVKHDSICRQQVPMSIIICLAKSQGTSMTRCPAHPAGQIASNVETLHTRLVQSTY